MSRRLLETLTDDGAYPLLELTTPHGETFAVASARVHVGQDTAFGLISPTAQVATVAPIPPHLYVDGLRTASVVLTSQTCDRIAELLDGPTPPAGLFRGRFDSLEFDDLGDAQAVDRWPCTWTLSGFSSALRGDKTYFVGAGVGLTMDVLFLVLFRYADGTNANPTVEATGFSPRHLEQTTWTLSEYTTALEATAGTVTPSRHTHNAWRLKTVIGRLDDIKNASARAKMMPRAAFLRPARIVQEGLTPTRVTAEYAGGTVLAEVGVPIPYSTFVVDGSLSHHFREVSLDLTRMVDGVNTGDDTDIVSVAEAAAQAHLRVSSGASYSVRQLVMPLGRLLRRQATHGDLTAEVRQAITDVLALEVDDLVALDGDSWPATAAGAYFVRDVAHTITADDWTINLVLIASTAATGVVVAPGRPWYEHPAAITWNSDYADMSWIVAP